MSPQERLAQEWEARPRTCDGETAARLYAGTWAYNHAHILFARITELERRVEAVRREALEEAAAIATFYVPGETQSADARHAPNFEVAWAWGVNHAATRIAQLLLDARSERKS